MVSFDYHGNRSNFPAVQTTLIGVGDFDLDLVVRSWKRDISIKSPIIIPLPHPPSLTTVGWPRIRHQVGFNRRTALDQSIGPQPLITLVTVESELNARMISVALEALARPKVRIRVTTNGHEGTIRIDALCEEFIRPQVVAADKLANAHEEGSAFLFNVIRHALTTTGIILSAIGEEVYVTNHFLHP